MTSNYVGNGGVGGNQSAHASSFGGKSAGMTGGPGTAAPTNNNGGAAPTTATQPTQAELSCWAESACVKSGVGNAAFAKSHGSYFRAPTNGGGQRGVSSTHQTQIGGGTSVSHAAPTSASHAAPTSASHAAPTSASHAAPTSASHAAPTTASQAELSCHARSAYVTSRVGNAAFAKSNASYFSVPNSGGNGGGASSYMAPGGGSAGGQSNYVTLKPVGGETVATSASHAAPTSGSQAAPTSASQADNSCYAASACIKSGVGDAAFAKSNASYFRVPTNGGGGASAHMPPNDGGGSAGGHSKYVTLAPVAPVGGETVATSASHAAPTSASHAAPTSASKAAPTTATQPTQAELSCWAESACVKSGVGNAAFAKSHGSYFRAPTNMPPNDGGGSAAGKSKHVTLAAVDGETVVSATHAVPASHAAPKKQGSPVSAFTTVDGGIPPPKSNTSYFRMPTNSGGGTSHMGHAGGGTSKMGHAGGGTSHMGHASGGNTVHPKSHASRKPSKPSSDGGGQVAMPAGEPGAHSAYVTPNPGGGGTDYGVGGGIQSQYAGPR
ncbi:unnamed protein product [Caenorhabditis angaria]|uniref:Uncharacterized protein n=1 Tax=Caenorhabditis angaria TaxID=860376 RepID=A0A9P1IP36_9PELO|nr:unnamed protein product [Caenorhabditis angaria]